MRIAVYADTHRNMKAIKKAVETAGKVDLNIHLGDNHADAREIERLSGVHCMRVRGNCDAHDRDADAEIVTELCGHRFLITHGHLYGVKRGLERLLWRAREVGADAALYGHTHRRRIDGGNPMLINPGSLFAPQGGVPSFALLDVDKRVEARIIALTGV